MVHVDADRELEAAHREQLVEKERARDSDGRVVQAGPLIHARPDAEEVLVLLGVAPVHGEHVGEVRLHGEIPGLSNVLPHPVQPELVDPDFAGTPPRSRRAHAGVVHGHSERDPVHAREAGVSDHRVARTDVGRGRGIDLHAFAARLF